MNRTGPYRLKIVPPSLKKSFFTLSVWVISYLFISTCVAATIQTLPEGFNHEEPGENSVFLGLDRLLERDREPPESLQKAIALLNDEQYAQAIELASELINSNPELPFAHEILGLALLKQGNTDSALKALEDAEVLLPEDSPLLTTIGNLHAQKGSLDIAEKYYRKAISLDNNPYANWGLGAALARQNKNRRAIKYLQNAYTGESQQDVNISIFIGALYNRTGQYDEALALLKRHESVEEQYPGIYIVKGNAYTGRQMYDRAIASYMALRKVETDTNYSALLLGTVYKLNGQLEKAATELGLAVKNDPGNSLAHYHLGDAYRQLGRSDKAIYEFKESLSLTPDLLGAMRGLAFTYIDIGNYQEAIRLGEAVVKEIPENSTAHYQLATYYHQAQQPDKAIQHYRKSFELNPQHLLALNNLATLLSARKEQLDEAYRYAVQAKKLITEIDGISDTLASEIYDTIGWIHALTNRNDEAITLLAIAQKKAPANPSILYRLAVVYHKTQQDQQALAALDKAFQITSKFPESKEAENLVKELKN